LLVVVVLVEVEEAVVVREDIGVPWREKIQVVVLLLNLR
jgi:hypothetical protein